MFYPTKNSKVAIIIDGAFFTKRYFSHYNTNFSKIDPKQFAKNIHTHSLKHLQKEKGEELYRIYYYDCHPLNKKGHYPKSQKSFDSTKTETYKFQTELYKELINLPCFALRYGQLNQNNAKWDIVDNKKEELLKGKIKFDDLQDNDFIYRAKQKGVDIKIGIDIATLSIKRLVNKIVLIAGDNDFIPAIKLARTEGVQIVLDPMHNPISPEMRENIDYLTTKLKPKK